MFSYRLNSLLTALGFVACGLILLLFTQDALGDYQTAARMILAGLFVVGGVIFFGAYVAARANWWRLIPAWTLVTLGGLIFAPLPANLTGTRPAALLFGGLALAFAHIYLLNRREHWWAIMPGGFMGVLAGVIFLSELIASLPILGAILFIGMGLVFGLVYLLGDRSQHWWAVLPGIILVTFGLFFGFAPTGESSLLARWWPLLLILIGLGIGWRGLRQPMREKIEVHATPTRKPAVTSGQAGRTLAEKSNVGGLAEYTRPAPGASVEVLPDDR